MRTFSSGFLSLLLAAALLGVAGPGQAREIGVFLGGYSKDSDIAEIQGLASSGAWDRSFATYVGLDLAHNLRIPLIEYEYTLGFAFGAKKSAKPNAFVSSANFNLILPLQAVRIKPFAGAGLGFIYNFGETSTVKDIASYLGNKWIFQFNVGGGTKVKLNEAWWLRLSLRDYIVPSLKKAVRSTLTGQPLYSTVKKSTHNISFSAAIARNF